MTRDMLMTNTDPDYRPKRCITNMRISDKRFVMEAQKLAGIQIEWRDTPDERMSGFSKEEQAKYGSIWTTGIDLSAFWSRYYETKAHGLQESNDQSASLIGEQRLRIAELEAALREMEAENAEAQDLLVEFKAEVAKLAESDPEFDALQKQRFPEANYSGSWERGTLKASAENYRKAVLLSLGENLRQARHIVDLEAALKPFADRIDRIETQVFWKEAENDLFVRGVEAVTLGDLRKARAVLTKATP